MYYLKSESINNALKISSPTSISSIVKSPIEFVINCACVNYVNNFPIFIDGEYSFQISYTFVIKV